LTSRASVWTWLLLGARRPGPPAAETLPLDLAHLDSVRSFAAAVGERLGATPIDALVLNAGRSGDADGRSVDGLEITFAVNHLAHYLLLRLLLPRLANHARIVLTTSGTHDPAQRAPLPPPRHANARLLAHPELDPVRDQRPRSLPVAPTPPPSSASCSRPGPWPPSLRPRRASSPWLPRSGRTPGTGLLRHEGLVLRALWQVLGSPLLRPLVPRANSRKAAGGALAELALGRVRPPAGRIYAALRRGELTWPDPSELACRDDLMHTLWRDSAELIGSATRRPIPSRSAPTTPGRVVDGRGSDSTSMPMNL
jgi:short chain dehydrogenase